MELSSLAGNLPIKEQLSRCRDGEPAHAYLLAGPAGSGRHTLARLLAQAMVCSAPPEARPCGHCPGCKKAAAGIHPDILVHGPAAPEDKPLSVDQVRAIRTDAYIRPNEAPRKVYLLEQADRMNASAQNALLKLLEEGPAYAAFLLLCRNAQALLPTVRSRCETLTLLPVSPQEGEEWLGRRFPQADKQHLRQAALDCQGILGRAVEELAGEDGPRKARREQAAALAVLLEGGGELALLESCLALEKLPREELTPLLEETRSLLVSRLPAAPNPQRSVRAAELLQSLLDAQQLNVGQGQLAGWLCAGVFL